MLDEKDRFCPQCGFDTIAGVAGSATAFKPVDQPRVIQQVDPVSHLAEPDLPPAVQAPKPVVSPTEPAPESKPAYVSPVSTAEPATQLKGKKSGLWIALVILGVGLLGVSGWYGYNTYFASSDENTVDTENLAAPEVSNFDTTVPEPKVIEEPPVEAPAGATTEKQKTPTKSQSRVDQELAKYKAEKQTKSTSQSTPAAQQAKPEAGVKISGSTSVNTPPLKVLMEVGKKEDPKSKNPKNPAKLNISKSTMVVRITTDHYNDGMGTASSGTITIKDKGGNVIGVFRTSGRSGKNGTPNTKWVAQINKILDKGTYFILDSDMSTWSKTFLGSGFIIVEGYETE
jgi:hypothetical protein